MLFAGLVWFGWFDCVALWFLGDLWLLFSGALRYALSVLILVSGCFVGLALVGLRVCCFWVGLRVCGLVWWYWFMVVLLAVGCLFVV